MICRVCRPCSQGMMSWKYDQAFNWLSLGRLLTFWHQLSGKSGQLQYLKKICHYIIRGFLTRMVYLYYISCLRYTILAGNPRIILCHYFMTPPAGLVWLFQESKVIKLGKLNFSRRRVTFQVEGDGGGGGGDGSICGFPKISELLFFFYILIVLFLGLFCSRCCGVGLCVCFLIQGCSQAWLLIIVSCWSASSVLKCKS